MNVKHSTKTKAKSKPKSTFPLSCISQAKGIRGESSSQQIKSKNQKPNLPSGSNVETR